MGMTRAFHAGSTGSNPVRGTTDSHVVSSVSDADGIDVADHGLPTKRCSMCREQLELDAFHRNAKSSDGRQSNCKSCIREYQKSSEQWREGARRRAKLQAKRKPEQVRAKAKVAYAIQHGRLVRPDTCSMCSAECKPDAHHHLGYDFPLDVQWLCRSCHITIEPRRTKREAASTSIDAAILATLAFAAAVLIIGLAITPRAEAKPHVAVCKRHHDVLDRRACIIRVVFGRHGRDAVRVAWCESRLDPKARNGQYRGTFQMGSRERARFGHGRTVLAQARAAKRYFDLAGWQPWECRP